MSNVWAESLPGAGHHRLRDCLPPSMHQMLRMYEGLRGQGHVSRTPGRPEPQAVLQVLLRQGIWHIRPQHRWASTDRSGRIHSGSRAVNVTTLSLSLLTRLNPRVNTSNFVLYCFAGLSNISSARMHDNDSSVQFLSIMSNGRIINTNLRTSC